MGSGAAVVGTGTQYLTANLSTLPLANSRPYIWAVLKLDSTAGVQYSVSPAGGGANGLRLFSNHFEGRWNCVGGLDAIVGPVADTNPHLIETGALATTAARLVVDGVAYAGNRTDAIAASQTSLWLLCSNTGLNIMTGRLSEFVISKNPPSAAQLLAMRAYFRARPYGLTIA
jgi:hypothetical protein